LTTQPGTEINVTPDKEALIIPKATINQGDFRFPKKNDSLLAFLLVKNEMEIRTRKYAVIINNTKYGDIAIQIVKE